MNYTKGEWKVSEFKARELRVCNEYENICYLVSMPLEGQELANAHLIAAAPDMYEACYAFSTALAIWQKDPAKSPITLATIFNETIGKALAKAEGKGGK